MEFKICAALLARVTAEAAAQTTLRPAARYGVERDRENR
jgi:hypothetical protein